MATTPQFADTPVIGFNANNITAANTARDGTGTVETIFTAGVNGGLLDLLAIQPKGTNIATVMRFFLNNGATNATASNNVLLPYEVGLPATTAIETAALAPVVIPFRLKVPPNYKINAVLGTAVAAGFGVTLYGGSL